MKTLWYTGCSMTRGDEIADTFLDPDFFNSNIWNDQFDYNSSISEEGTHSAWKSRNRKDRRMARLQQIAMMQESDPLKLADASNNFLEQLRNKEHELCWPAQLANRLGYLCIHDGESAASPGIELYRLIADIDNYRDIRIIAWTYPLRLTYWGSNKFLRYDPGWQPMHVNRHIDNNMTRQYFDYCFDKKATINEWVESVIISAELLKKINCRWYFTFGSSSYWSLINQMFPNFKSWLAQYEKHILSYQVFDDQYKLTDNLTPKAMYAGHPRVEAHTLLSEIFFNKIQNDISNNI